MRLHDNVVVTEDVINARFACNLGACQGACCVEGDAGAPLLAQEVPWLEENASRIRPYLTPEGRAALDDQGVAVRQGSDWETPLINGGACAYVTYDGPVAKCGIEQAYEAGLVDEPKPISCHLYPIRVETRGHLSVLRYDQWSICAPACSLGQETGTPLVRFLKDALIRAYGEAFYQGLVAALPPGADEAERPNNPPTLPNP